MTKKTILVAAFATCAALASSAALAVVAPAPAPAAPANLVQNGSFEDGSVPGAGGWGLYGSVPGWTESADNGGGLELRNAIAGNAQDGSIYAELDANSNMGISQTFATTAGQTYTLSFWWSYRDHNPYGAGSEGLSYSAGDLAGAVGPGTNVTGDNDWQHVTRTFTATGASTTLSFAAAGASDSYGTSLDNVTVTSAVPEPATGVLAAAGLALLGLARRRRSN